MRAFLLLFGIFCVGFVFAEELDDASFIIAPPPPNFSEPSTQTSVGHEEDVETSSLSTRRPTTRRSTTRRSTTTTSRSTIRPTIRPTIRTTIRPSIRPTIRTTTRPTTTRPTTSRPASTSRTSVPVTSATNVLTTRPRRTRTRRTKFAVPLYRYAHFLALQHSREHFGRDLESDRPTPDNEIEALRREENTLINQFRERLRRDEARLEADEEEIARQNRLIIEQESEWRNWQEGIQPPADIRTVAPTAIGKSLKNCSVINSTKSNNWIICIQSK